MYKLFNESIWRWFLLSLITLVLIQIAGIFIIKNEYKYDSKEYLSLSGNLFYGNGYSTNASFKGFESFKGESPTRMRQPGYPFYLVLSYWLTGQKVIVAQISQAILNIITFYLLLLILRNIFGYNILLTSKKSKWEGILIVIGIYFPLWITSAFILTETLFTFLLTLFMYTLLKAIQETSNRTSYFVSSGVLLGLAVLTRPIALPLLLLSIIIIILYVENFKKALLMWSFLVIGFVCILLPWTLRNNFAIGDFTFLSTDGGYNIWRASINEKHPAWLDSPEFKSAVKDGYYMDRNANNRFIALAIKNIKADPLSYLKRGLKRLLWVWTYFPGSQNYRDKTLIFSMFTVIQAVILLFAILGIYSVGGKIALYFLLPAIGFSCILFFTYATSRYIVPAMPFILILSGQGFWWLKQQYFCSKHVS